MPTIHEMLDQVVAYARQTVALALALKGEAQVEEPAPPVPPPPSKYTNGMSAPDALGRVELELVDKLRAEFGVAPNGYKIPSLWYVPGVVVSHLPESVRGDYQQNVAGAGFNNSVAFSYRDERGFWGRETRAKVAALADCVCWNGTLAELEAALRKRINVLLNEQPYRPEPNTGALDTVAGYLSLQSR